MMLPSFTMGLAIERHRCWLRAGSECEEDLGTELQNRLRNYRKLFHLLIGNCFITCHSLIETTVRRAPKFVSIGYFCGHLVTSVLLIELYPMIPFPSVVPLQILRPTFGASALPRDPGSSRGIELHQCRALGGKVIN